MSTELPGRSDNNAKCLPICQPTQQWFAAEQKVEAPPGEGVPEQPVHNDVRTFVGRTPRRLTSDESRRSPWARAPTSTSGSSSACLWRGAEKAGRTAVNNRRPTRKLIPIDLSTSSMGYQVACSEWETHDRTTFSSKSLFYFFRKALLQIFLENCILTF